MNSYALSQAAAADIRQITRHTVKEWGVDRAKTYILALHRTFENIATFPNTGRPVEERAGYFRFESESHAVFYRKTAAGILIVRVLHQRMQSERHL